MIEPLHQLSKDQVTDLVSGYRNMFDGQFSNDLSQPDLEAIFTNQIHLSVQNGSVIVHRSADESSDIVVYRYLDRDSETFGLKMERIDHVLVQDEKTAFELTKSYLLGAQIRGIQHISIRIAIDNLALEASLLSAGFEKLGSKSMLRYASCVDRSFHQMPDGVTVGPLQSQDLKSLPSLVGRNIEINRFSRDPHLDETKVPLIYEEWFQSLAKTQPKHIYVARITNSSDSNLQDNAIGIAACSIGIALYGELDLGQLKPGFVGLFAVDPAFRGRGIGNALLKTATKDLLASGCNVLFANTDHRNPGSIRAFQSAGFKPFSGFTELRWFKD